MTPAEAFKNDPDVAIIAEREFREEQRRLAIEARKDQLRAKAGRPWWVKLFPWRITIERRK